MTTTTTITSTVTSSPTCGVNVVSDYDFASGTIAPWVYTSTDQGLMAWGTGDGTTYSIELYTAGSGASTAAIAQTISTVSGETYTYTMNYKAISGNTASTLRCFFDNVYTTTYHFSLGSIASDIWRTYEGHFLASSSSTTMTCELSTSVIAVYI
ncbi:hypothetical protein N7454_003307 [Penicillium verhagenii]|nr:hypothetical protein N7454_003307 [Penicillium verhagenii]